MKPYAIIGFGKTGLSVARFLSREAVPFVFFDTRENPPGLEVARACFGDAAIHLGPLDPSLLMGMSALVVSPGLSVQEPAIQSASAQGLELLGDIELFARFIHSKQINTPLVTVTGSNGKSTVASWVAAMAEAAGWRVKLGGNVGTPALDLLVSNSPSETDLFVLELSSYQLETTLSLKASAAIILNVTPNHMDRYDAFADYVAAKQRIYMNTGDCIYNRLDPNTLPPQEAFASVGLDQPPARGTNYGIVDGQLVRGDEPILDCDDLALKGRHNWFNALAATALAQAVAVPMAGIGQGLKQFPGLPHRCKRVMVQQGVTWVNDSKGTTVEATLAAIEGLGAVIEGKVILIAGGRGKGVSFDLLVPAAQQYLHSAVLIGETAHELDLILAPHVATERASSLAKAVEVAQYLAIPGDLVLLSPACASFDMFRDYRDRGEQFERLVKERVGQQCQQMQ